MARRILYILLAVMAFQLSWNVVTGYCMHESGRAANHFGHHEHNISSDELTLAAKDKSGVSKKPTVHDAHCVSHANLAVVTPDLTPLLSIIDSTSMAVVDTVVSPASVFLTPPERPQWTSRA